MTKTRSTKSALVSSALSLVLCFSMLLGTTFAWFTDRVKTENNLIQSGNLDMEIYYQNDETSDWTKVDSQTNVFKKDTRWEPGHTEVVKLKIVNEGTLAFKYQLGVYVAAETGALNVNGDPFKLSSYIMFGIADGADDYASGEEAIAALENATPLSTAWNSGTETLAAANETNDDDEQILSLVVYMPSTVGNEANYMKGQAAPTINLGLNLLATQDDVEEDSFGPDYDEDAWMNGMEVHSGEDLQAAVEEGQSVKLMEDITLTEGIVIPETAATFSMRSTPAPLVIDLNGKNIIIETAYDANKSTASSAIVNYGNVVLTGKGTIKATNNYTVRNYGTMVVDGVTVENGMMNFADMTVESGNISNGRSGKHTIYGNAATLTINGGTFHNDNAGNAAIFSYAGEVVINGGEFTIADGTATFGWTSCLLDAQGGAKCTINGGIVKGEIRDYGKNTLVYGGTFTHNSVKNFLADGYKVANLNGEFIVVSENAVANTDELIAAINAGKTEIELLPGDYALRFTNNTGFNLNNTTIKGLGEAKLAITSSEVWYGRVQGSNVTFENVHFTTTVGTTGKASYNNCTFDSWTICASSGNEETYFNNCTINGCLNTSIDFSSGDVFVKNSTVAQAEYTGEMTVNFENCTIGEVIIWNSNTNFTNCDIAKMVPHITTAVITVDGTKTVAYDTTTTLQSALDSLNAGDTLILPAVTIETTGTHSVPHGVTIIGDENGGTVIRQNSAGQDDIFNCKGDATIMNISFETNRKGYAIADNTKNHDTNGNITVINCSFKGIAAEKNYGIYKNLNGNLTVQNCTFENYNNAICGVSNGNGSVTTIEGCTFTNINGEAIGYIASTTPADFEADVIANNTGLTEENVIGY